MAKEIYGWLTLDSEFQECECYNHRQACCIQDLWDELGYQDELDEIGGACEELIEVGDHPGWHCYEMAQDEYRSQVLEAAYRRGLIRVGTRGTKMHFEYGTGCLNSDNLMEAAKDLACRKFAESKGCDPVFEKVH